MTESVVSASLAQLSAVWRETLTWVHQSSYRFDDHGDIDRTRRNHTRCSRWESARQEVGRHPLLRLHMLQDSGEQSVFRTAANM